MYPLHQPEFRGNLSERKDLIPTSPPIPLRAQIDVAWTAPEKDKGLNSTIAQYRRITSFHRQRLDGTISHDTLFRQFQAIIFSLEGSWLDGRCLVSKRY